MDDRPLIRVEPGKLPAVVAECNRQLAARSSSMYVLGDLLVTLEELGLGCRPCRRRRLGSGLSWRAWRVLKKSSASPTTGRNGAK